VQRSGTPPEASVRNRQSYESIMSSHLISVVVALGICGLSLVVATTTTASPTSTQSLNPGTASQVVQSTTSGSITTTTEEMVSCYTCNGTEADCNSADTLSMSADVCDTYCWAYIMIPESGDMYAMRGCELNVTEYLTEQGYTGDASQVCSDDLQDGEVCYDLDDGDKHCFRCCEGDGCNSWILTGLEEDNSGQKAYIIWPLLSLVGVRFILV